MRLWGFALLVSICFSTAFIGNVSAQSGWSIQNSGVTQNLNSVYFLAIDTGFVASNGGVVLKTVDGGLNWSQLQIPTPVNLNGIHFFDPDTGVVVGNSGHIFRTTDGGINWTSVNSGISDALLSVSFSGNRGICGALSQSIIYSADRGASWSTAQSGFFGGGFYGAVMLSPSIGFVGGENSIFQPLVGKTTNGGASWNFYSFYLNQNEGKIYGIDFTDENSGYAASRVWDGRGAISKTSDGGATWTTAIFNDALYGIDFPVSNASQTGYAVGNAGIILKTVDAGSSWFPLNPPAAVRLNSVYFLDLDNGYVVGDGGIILKTNSGGEPPTTISEDGDNIVASTFFFGQNYPNPFNPSTTIHYSLGSQSFVTIKVYDMNGREVVTLLNKNEPEGKHSVQWNGTNYFGNPAGSGVYVARMTVKNLAAGREYESAMKMLLIR